MFRLRDYLTYFYFNYARLIIIISGWLLLSSVVAFPRALLAQSLPITVADNSEEYFFDDTLLLGASNGLASLVQLQEANSVIPGSYELEIYVNNKFLFDQNMVFAEMPSTKVEPCFTLQFMRKIGVIEDKLQIIDENASCLPLSALLDDASYSFNLARLRLNLSIAQATMVSYPADYINPDSWARGENMAFINYMTNSYYTSQNDNFTHYLGTNLGVNVGLWRFSQLANYSYEPRNGGQWQWINRYVKRPFQPIRAELTIGDSYTNGRLLSGMAYRGFQLASDERMLPSTQTGYAPVIHGIALSNAKVVVKQNNNIVHEITVSPGPFLIENYFPSTNGGDLTVNVYEADGSISSFVVPYSVVPQALRMGLNRYSLAIGKARNDGDGNQVFAEMSYQQGVSNNLTLNVAGRFADGYRSLLLGNAMNTPIGAFAFSGTFSAAKLPENEYEKGWMAGATYSRIFQTTGTIVSLANYRYSSQGYRDLSDFIGLWHAYEQQNSWSSRSYLQRSRIEVSINQTLADKGTLYFNGSTQRYRDQRPRDRQFQVSYSNNWGTLNYGVNLTRTYNHFAQKYENVFMLNFFFPLFKERPSASVGNSILRNSDGKIGFQSSLSDIVGNDNSLNYHISITKNPAAQQTTWGGSMQKLASIGSMSASYSNSGSHWQSALSLQGSAVMHSGGLTLGQYLSDSFALVEAKNAEGSLLLTGQGIYIDRFGYAIVPSLSPYRTNQIIIDTNQLNMNVDLVDNKKSVVPYAGVAVKTTFNTLLGYPILLTVRLDDDQSIPLGALVYDDDTVIGMVGQGSQIYIRSNKLSAKLWVRWGEHISQQCSLSYQLTEIKPDTPLYRYHTLCQ